MNNHEELKGKHLTFAVSVEEARAAIAESEADPEIQRLIESLEEAKRFRASKEHNRPTLTVEECKYFACRVYAGDAGLWDLMLDIENIVFQRAYKRAIQQERAKNRREKKA